MNDQWFYGEDGQQRGPISLAALRDRMAAGHTRADDLVWREGMPNWLPASTVPELAGAIPAGPAVITPGMQAPVQPGYGGYDFDSARLARRSSTALTCGILAIVFALCCGPVGLGLGIAAIINGRNAKGSPNPGNALAGLVCGGIGIALAVLNMIAGVIMVANQH